MTAKGKKADSLLHKKRPGWALAGTRGWLFNSLRLVAIIVLVLRIILSFDVSRST